MKFRNKALLSFFVMASFMLAIGLASANADMVTPASSASIAGTANLNASGTNLLNCTFYSMSSSTANNTWSSIGTFVNDTSGASSINGTFASTVLEDSNDYIFNATCVNSSNFLHDGTTTTGITIDNTVPQAPSSLSPSDSSEIKTTTTQTFSATVTNANTTACTYIIARGGASSGNDYISGSATYSASTCSFTKTFSSTLDNGVWYWSLTASDGTNTTSSAQNKVVVNFPGSGGGGYQPLSVAGDGDDGEGSNALYWAVGAIVVIFIFLIAYFGLKKK